MKRRILTVLLAVVLAVAGTASVLAYVHKADERALAGMKAVTVVVAQGQIPAGTTASSAQHAGLLGTERLPASSVPPNALRSLTAALGSLVTSSVVASGQVLLRPMLVPAALVTGALAIPKGMMAVTMALCVPEDVAGSVKAGSLVDIFDTFAAHASSLGAQPNCEGPHQQQASGSAHTQLVLSSVEVLSVGSQANSARGGAANSVNSELVTLAVSLPDAERVISLTQAGLPYLALLPSSALTHLTTANRP